MFKFVRYGKGFDPEVVRDFLDSAHGRHLADVWASASQGGGDAHRTWAWAGGDKRIKTFMRTYDPAMFESADPELEDAKERAREESKAGHVVHVNKTKSGGYALEDWFDDKATVASYENGRALKESADYKVLMDKFDNEALNLGPEGVLASIKKSAELYARELKKK